MFNKAVASTDLDKSPHSTPTSKPPLLKTLKPSLPTEEDGKEVEFTKDIFRNWGRSVVNKPAYTFYPKTKVGLSHIVTWAKNLGMQVRVAAYRHTWTSLYSSDNEVLISLLGKKDAEAVPAIHFPLGTNAFQSIDLVGEEFKENGQIKHLCKLGAATTGEQIRTWALNNLYTKGPAFSWTPPYDVIMVENTIAGTSSMMCHGAGINNKTLSDLITEIEFVNPRGELQTIGYKVTDPIDKQKEGQELIKSAAGAFGKLGVVTAVTVKFDRMTHALMKPSKPRLALAVPPPDGFVLPKTLPSEIMHNVTSDQLNKAKADFISRCENDYFSEWFWFSLHKRCWVNTWKNNGDPAESKSYPCPLEAKIQEIQAYLGGIANKSVLRLFPSSWQAMLLSDAAMLSLPAGEEITTPLIDALHFRRGIQNMRVQDMEFEIPIPLLPNGKPDWSICQRAWWDAIVTVYEWQHKTGRVPMRLPLEMRVMGGSDATMAAQKGNQATCSIEVLTIEEGLVDKKEWLAFMQALTDKWASYTDFRGKPLNIRPHWAKQWEGLTIERKGEKRKPMVDYLKEDAYKDTLPVFKQHLEQIALKGGYNSEEFGLFSNPLLDFIFEDKKMELREFKISVEEKSHSKEALFSPSTEIKKSVSIPNDLELGNIKQLNKLVKKAVIAHKAKQRFLNAKLNNEMEINEEKFSPDISDESDEDENSALQSVFSWFASQQKMEEEKLCELEDKLEEQNCGHKHKDEIEEKPAKTYCCFFSKSSSNKNPISSNSQENKKHSSSSDDNKTKKRNCCF